MSKVKAAKYYPAQYEPTEHPELTRLRALQPKNDPQGYKRKQSESDVKQYWIVHSEAGKALQVASVVGAKCREIVGNGCNYFKGGKPNLSMPVTFTHVDTTVDYSEALDMAIDEVLYVMPTRAEYTADDLAKAIRIVGYGESISNAARITGVPRKTLSDAIRHP